jgi:hypothetical protein
MSGWDEVDSRLYYLLLLLRKKLGFLFYILTSESYGSPPLPRFGDAML